MAVESVEHVTSVQTDMNENTVTVSFDDEKVTMETIIAALNDAGYLVKGQQQVQ